ncbi:MAG TPA: hypothetical protein VOB72_12890 [Candidatus Dormibacteraeota bacterium]|nr:hypothetical protein [Candidatus Dormibacteraeota bacterium]
MSEVPPSESAAHAAVEPVPEPAPEPPAEAAPSPGRRAWRRWFSAGLFLLVAGCFGLPFASTSCTLPGGYGRGVQGTSTVYRGVDLAFDSVPAVTPADRQPRPDSLPDDGQLGFQPLALLALLGMAAGIGVSLRTGAGATAVYGAAAAILLGLAQWAAVTAIAGAIGGPETLPRGKSQTDYVSTGPGFVLGLALLVALLAVNLVAIGWEARRARAPGGLS